MPGNHDWYDGLTSFLRVFCRRAAGSAAGGRGRRRSYFALRLPHNWWLWAIDIQFDTYLDTQQLEYFEDVGSELGEDDRVILVTAKPSWVRAEADVTEPVSWRYLSYFEEKYVKAAGARLAATLTGDLHHYSRYQPADGRGPVEDHGGRRRRLPVAHAHAAGLAATALAGAEQSVPLRAARRLPGRRAVRATAPGRRLKLGVKNPASLR